MYKSDHNQIVFNFIKSRQCRGKGLWKFNNQLLHNQHFIDLVKEEIFLAKSYYVHPVYSPNSIKENNGENLGLNISDTLFLDILLCQLGRAIIDYSRKLQKKERLEEKELLEMITCLEKKWSIQYTSRRTGGRKKKLEYI